MTLIDSWDSGQPNALWDVGLQWDINIGPNPGDPQPWLDLITSEHNQKPLFMETVRALLQPLADIKYTMELMPEVFDLDTAVGAQLDAVGEWIGVGRNLAVPISDIYFSFDVSGLGFDEGTWKGPFDPANGLVTLPDDAYRTLLKARAVNNRWGGTIEQAYAVWAIVFEGTGTGILIQDLQHMHMLVAITGPVPDALTLALIKGGYINLKPAGVKVDDYLVPAEPGAPYFAFDVDNATMAGFDEGYWGASA